jgi:hypothetical protein
MEHAAFLRMEKEIEALERREAKARQKRHQETTVFPSLAAASKQKQPSIGPNHSVPCGLDVDGGYPVGSVFDKSQGISRDARV